MDSVVLRGHRDAASPPPRSSVLPEARWLPWRKAVPCFPSFGFNAEVRSFSYIKCNPTTLAKNIKYLQLNFTGST